MSSKIYYFNNAATTWPKPQCVIDNVINYFENPPTNSSRHCNCIKKSTDVDNVCKSTIADFFNVDRSKYDITITNGSTYSANIVINWLSQKHNKQIYLICDSSAHNSIYRTHFEKIGTKPIIFPSWNQIPEQLFNPSEYSYYVVVTHVNNIDGTIIDDKQLHSIFNLFRPFNIPIILDITQSAGIFKIDISNYNYDNLYIVCSGHKGLYSTTGIGFLISPHNIIDIPLISGGTGGVQGIDYEHTNSLEAGTPNELAMWSLIGGIKYIKNESLENIQIKKEILIEYFLQKYNSFQKLQRFNETFELVDPPNKKSGLICFKIKNKFNSDDIIGKLNDYQIYVRSGVHCSPLYHINVLKCNSTLRLSFGLFNNKSEIDYFFDILLKLIV